MTVFLGVSFAHLILLLYCDVRNKQYYYYYLLDWEFILNVNIHLHDTRTSSKIHTVRTKHEFAKKCMKYNLPHINNDTPAIVVEKIHTHSLRGFTTYAKQFLIQKYTDTVHVQYKIVIRVINIIIRNVYLMDGNHIFWHTHLSSFFSSLHSSISTHPPSPSHF